jgi:hypothetical protein
MKKNILILIVSFWITLFGEAQSKYLSDILTKADIRNNRDYLAIGINYWRYDTCMYSKQMCKYNHSTAFDVKISHDNQKLICELLRSNNSGYQSKIPYDTFTYIFSPQGINGSKLVRKLLIKEKYVRTDTFILTAIDTLMFTNYSSIKNVFGKSQMPGQKTLKIYVLKSVDEFGSTILHYWVERIGIVKLTDEKCWRYSFEMSDDRTKAIGKMYAEIMKLIKAKYKDPYWLSDPCGVER